MLFYKSISEKLLLLHLRQKVHKQQTNPSRISSKHTLSTSPFPAVICVVKTSLQTVKEETKGTCVTLKEQSGFFTIRVK